MIHTILFSLARGERLRDFKGDSALIAIAIVHSDNRVASRIALGLFSTAIAVCLLLLASHDRPFTGQLSISPAVLLNVQPEQSRAP